MLVIPGGQRVKVNLIPFQETRPTVKEHKGLWDGGQEIRVLSFLRKILTRAENAFYINTKYFLIF